MGAVGLLNASDKASASGARSPLAGSALFWALEEVRLPDGSAFDPYRYQAAFLADRSPSRLVLKARQVGMTTAVAVEIAHEALFIPRSLALVISKDQPSASEVIGKVRDVYENLAEPPRFVKDNEGELVLANGSRIVSQAATKKAGRGFTATSVTLDEFAFAEYAERIFRAVSPTLARGGRLTVLSTPDGQGNLFYRLYQGLERGSWSRHRIHWQDCPVFDEAWFERERPKYHGDGLGL
jgi:phage FluMu gp28-like protein